MMMSAQRDLDGIVTTLCRISRDQSADPYQILQWPESLGKDQWCFTPEFISIGALPEYERLSEQERKRLSFYEAVNFFSLNIHGEKALIEGLAKNLYRRHDPFVSPYLHHFLAEENRHMTLFGEFCTRYAGKIYPDKKMAVPREFADGEEEFLFFIKVMIFEEVVDVYNRTMADDSRLVPLARQINRLHHVDESRHLAFGRVMAKWLFKRYSPQWSDETLIGIRNCVAAYLEMTWREYYNAEVYRDAGLEDPYGLCERAWARPQARAHRRRINQRVIQYLQESGILWEAPTS